MKLNVATLFEDAAERAPSTVVHLDRPFDIAPEGGLSYGMEKLAALVGEAAGWLAAGGVVAGDRVAIVKENHWDINLLAFAAVRAGAVPALLSSELGAEQLAVLLGRLGASLLVTTPAVLASALGCGVDLTTMARRTLSLQGRPPGALDLDSVRGQKPVAPHRFGDGEHRFINCTSGTTGLPKLAVHSVTTMVRRLAAFEAHRWPVIGCRREDAVASASAFAHSRTVCWTAVVLALRPREILILSDHDPARAEPVLQAHRPTLLEGLPATFIRWRGLAASAGNPFCDVRLYLSAYDAVHPSTVRAFLAASKRPRPLWLQAFGQTETGPVTMRLFGQKAFASKQDHKPITRDQGWPLPFASRVRVVDPVTGRTAKPGTPGMVLAWTKGHCVDYVGEHQRWKDKVDGWWFNTGDLGIKARSGKLFLLDREVDAVPEMSCLEIEDVLDERLPDVLECIVLGTPGKLPLPVVVTSNGDFDRATWDAAVKGLPRLSEPVSRSWAQVPRTPTGKVQRFALREQLEGVGATFGTGRWT